MGMIQEFKDFAVKGNMVDMAVGIIIGGAFGKIVSSLVADVIMPPLGMLTGGVDFSDQSYELKAASMGADGPSAAVTVNWGNFVQVTFDFLIVAFAVFLMVKVLNAAKRKEEAAPAPPAPPSQEVLLLTEIRDALRK